MNTRFSIAIFLMSMTFYACGNGHAPSSKFKLATEIGEIRFDDSITHFKQAEVISNGLGKEYVFSLHGKADLKNEKPTTGFFIAPLKFMDYQYAKDHLDKFANGYGKNYGYGYGYGYGYSKGKDANKYAQYYEDDKDI